MTERQLNFFIPESWHEYLRQKAFDERVSIASLCRQALRTAYPDLPEEGRKGGEVYGNGGLPASVCHDGS